MTYRLSYSDYAPASAPPAPAPWGGPPDPPIAITLPYLRTSPVHIPRRDLVLGRANSLFLRVTVIESDSVDAQPIDLTGGIGGPVLQMLVWPDHCHRTSWDYGAPTQCPHSVLWSGLGTPLNGAGSFDVTFPTATMSGWPRRCAYALQLDYDGGGGTDLLATGYLHLAYSVPRVTPPVIMLTDPSQPVLHDVILLEGTL
jgi:hypothetical protein